MTAQATVNPLPHFTDSLGLPLANGRVYFGEANTDPIANPVDVFFDEDMTIPASQPLRTQAGYLWRNGAPANVWVDSAYSVLVQDAQGRQVSYTPEWDSANAQLRAALAAADGASLIGFKHSGASTLLRTLLAKILELPASLKDYGAVGDGVTDDLVAINAAIADLNAGLITSLYCPAGTYLTSAIPNAITASGGAITGAGTEVTTFLMAASAGTAGTFFTVGTGATRVTTFAFDNFSMECGNKTTLNGTGNAIVLTNAAQVNLLRLRCSYVNGFLTLGSTASATTTNKTFVERCITIQYGPAGGVGIRCESFAGGNFVACDFSSSGTAAASFRGLKVIPGAADTADVMKFVNCEWNYPGGDPQYIVEYDGTNNSIGNQQFVNCVFDQSVAGANIYCHIDAAPSTKAKIHIVITGCISNASTNSSALLLDNTGAGVLIVHWQGGHISQTGVSGRAATVQGGQRVDLMLDGVDLVSRSSGTPTDAVRIGSGCSGVQVLNCRTPRVALSTGVLATPFTYLVSFQGSATNCVVAGCDITSGGALNHIQWVAQPTTGLETIDIRNNMPATTLPFVATTAAATPAIVYTYTLAENKMTKITVIANGRANASTIAAQANYELSGLYFRPTAGATTLMGTVNYVLNADSGGTADAALSISGNTVRLTLTPTATNTMSWMFDVDVLEQ